MNVQRARRGLRLPLAALAVAAVALLLPGVAWAPIFTGGPSVRVTANERVEFKWTTDVAFFGAVAVFDNPDGIGTPLAEKRDENTGGDQIASTQHTITINVGAPLAANTGYFFRVTAFDPTGSEPSFSTPTPLPPFFTAAQAIGDVAAVPGTDSAQISWDANVIGFGRVEYGPSTAYGQSAEDAQNVTGHSFLLTGLEPGTTYYFRISNRHAIDGDELAEQTGSFTTQTTLFTGQFLSPLTQSTDPASPVLNTGKNGRVIPVKVQISQSGEAITDLNAPGPVTIAVSALACGTSAGSDPVTSYADAGQSSAGTNQFGYDAGIGAWIYNLDTKALGLVSGNCYRIDVSVDGVQITNAFAIFQPTK
jgi:hypothetical protein